MRHNRRLRWATIPLAVFVTVVLAGCTQAQLNGFLPGFVKGEPPVTNHTQMMSTLWVQSWIVLLIVGIIVWAMIIWAVIVYRRRKGETRLPAQIRYHMPLEIFYTIVPLILIIGFFAFTAKDQDAIEKPNAAQETVTVFGKQWSWDFQYDTAGTYDPGVQAQITSAGSVENDADLPTLYLPVNVPVKIVLESRDVIHSFWVPAFLYKKDVIPGHPNDMYLTPEREGTYAGKCAELCGEYHSAMLFQVKVVSQSQFDAQMSKLKSEGYSGTLGNDNNRNQNLPGTGASTYTNSNSNSKD